MNESDEFNWWQVINLEKLYNSVNSNWARNIKKKDRHWWLHSWKQEENEMAMMD